MSISWLNSTPHAIAVYASWPSLPPAHATLTTERPATALLGPVLHRLDCASHTGAFANRDPELASPVMASVAQRPDYAARAWRVDIERQCSTPQPQPSLANRRATLCGSFCVLTYFLTRSRVTVNISAFPVAVLRTSGDTSSIVSPLIFASRTCVVPVGNSVAEPSTAMVTLVPARV